MASESGGTKRKRRKQLDDDDDDASSTEDMQNEQGQDSAIMKSCSHVAGVHIDAVRNALLDPSLWSCRECNHTESCWACLSCGYVGCGRYQGGHALAHHEATQHPIVFEINTKYCHCYKCDAYLDNDNKRCDIAALRTYMEQLQTHTIGESRTRSGRLLKSSSKVKIRPRDYTADDRVSTVVKHWQLHTLSRAFGQWRWFVETKKLEPEEPRQHAPGFSSLFPLRPATSSDRGADDNEDSQAQPAAELHHAWNFNDARSVEEEDEILLLDDGEGDEAEASKKRKRDEEQQQKQQEEEGGEDEGERPAEDQLQAGGPPREGADGGEAAERRGEADTEHEQATGTGIMESNSNEVSNGESSVEQSPAPASPRQPKRVVRRRRGLLANLDMDGPSPRPRAIFLSPVARPNLVPGQTGLRNLGNTCFMNAVLQALSHTLQFRNYFVVDFLPKDKKGKLWRRKTIDCLERITAHQPAFLDDISISAEIHNIFRVVWSGRWAVVTPFALLDALWKFVPRFRNYQQQDAQEFLVYLLDKLHEELTSLHGSAAPPLPPPATGPPKKPAESIISKTFRGGLLSLVTCSSCGNVSSKREPYLDLSLDIPVQHAPLRSTRGKARSVPSCSIYDCLDSFTRAEELTDYFCEKCKSKRDASKRFVIETLPDVLCIVLKRFCWTTTSRAKVDTKVVFPLIGLDLAAFSSEGQEANTTIFDLRSVVIHHGSGPTAGHYTAFCYHTEQETWLHFNDSRVSVASPQEVASAQAYLLFYQRRTEDDHVPLLALLPAPSTLAHGESDESSGDSDSESDEQQVNNNKPKQRRGSKRTRIQEEDDSEEAASDDDSIDDEQALEEMSRNELQAALRKLGLSTAGLKATLLKRLKEARRRAVPAKEGKDKGATATCTSTASSSSSSSSEAAPVKRRVAKRTRRALAPPE